jgi:hypothetical protein
MLLWQHCFVLYTHEGLDARVAVVDVAAAGIDGGAPRSVALPADTVDLFPGANMVRGVAVSGLWQAAPMCVVAAVAAVRAQDFRASSVRFSLASATAPEVDYDCSTATLQMRKVFQQSVGGAWRGCARARVDVVCRAAPIPLLCVARPQRRLVLRRSTPMISRATVAGTRARMARLYP